MAIYIKFSTENFDAPKRYESTEVFMKSRNYKQTNTEFDMLVISSSLLLKFLLPNWLSYREVSISCPCSRHQVFFCK